MYVMRLGNSSTSGVIPKSEQVKQRRKAVEAAAALFVRGWQPRAGSGVVKMDQIRFLAECLIRRLNQA